MTSNRAIHELVGSSFFFYTLCMSYIKFNPNPDKKNIGDCVVRAVCAATDCDWESAYIKVVLRGFIMHDMPSSDDVWGTQLYSEGFTRSIVPNTCPYCYTVKDFCNEHPEGGTPGPIAIALTLGGEPILTSKAIVTPAAADEYFNVTSTAIITVPRGCCFNISVENVSESATPATTPAPQINVQNANLVVSRIA